MAACTKDELADGDRLPEGQYPLEIARITLGVEGGEAQLWGTRQTRASFEPTLWHTMPRNGSVAGAGFAFAAAVAAVTPGECMRAGAGFGYDARDESESSVASPISALRRAQPDCVRSCTAAMKSGCVSPRCEAAAL